MLQTLFSSILAKIRIAILCDDEEKCDKVISSLCGTLGFLCGFMTVFPVLCV